MDLRLSRTADRTLLPILLTYDFKSNIECFHRIIFFYFLNGIMFNSILNDLAIMFLLLNCLAKINDGAVIRIHVVVVVQVGKEARRSVFPP